MDDSQSVELRDRAGMAITVLTLQQCRVAPLGLTMTLAAEEIARFVGWVERSETHHRSGQQLIDIAALHPSYKLSSTRISDSIRTSRHVGFAFRVQSGSLPRAG